MNKALTILVHIPKTAGETFKHNVEKCLPPDQFLRTSFNYSEPYYDMQEKKIKFFNGKENFKRSIQNWTDQEKNRLKCIGGHDSYYGIHKLFEKQPKYVAFFREPISRTISLYNYERMAWEIYSNKKKPHTIFERDFLKRLNNFFLINHQIPTFEEWLNQRYNQECPFYYSMTRTLQSLHFLPESLPTTLPRSILLEGLSKFYFLGTVATFDEDSAYLYHELGINQFAPNTNASPHYVKIETLEKRVIERIKELNQGDLLLYEMVCNENQKFKKKTKNFFSITQKVQRQKKWYLLKTKITNNVKLLFHHCLISIKEKLKRYQICVALNQKLKGMHVKKKR